MSTLTLRPATPADLDAVWAIEAAVFGPEAWSREMMREELTADHRAYVVLVDESDAVLGYGGLLAAGPEGDIQTIAVVPELRGTGNGRRVMNALLDAAAERRVREVFLEVRADNPVARSLYASLGFAEIGTRPKYYRPEGVDAVMMRLRMAERIAFRAEPARLLPRPTERSEGRLRMAERIAFRAEPARLLPRPTERSEGQALYEGSPINAAEPLVLGIETSCDETGVGIVRGRTLLANTVASSMDEHARFGGVVPEVAARAHLEALTPTIERAVAEAGIRLGDLDAIAVTCGPGLAGALMVGVSAAKALAISLDVPLYAVNHLVGHVGADLLLGDGLRGVSGSVGDLELPTVALLVSGGHTSLLLVRDLVSDVELLGETIDDAAGEAFDKVARLLGLPYPGGPQIDRVAAEGDPEAIRFPRGLTLPKDLVRHRYDFSFSGLKTSVARWVEKRESAGLPIPVADVAAGFREAVADVLTAKAIAACRDLGVPRLLLGGGVAANARVRELAAERAAAAGVALRVPPLSLCTDNGAMIASLGAQLVMAGRAPSGLGFGADSTLPVTEIQC